MQIQVQLFSVLREYLPPGSVRGRTTVSLPDQDETSLTDLVSILGIDRRLGVKAEEFVTNSSWQILVNGCYEQDMGCLLRDGDVVQVFPPIAGGSRVDPEKTR